MTITTLSSREFNQDTVGAKNAATHGPVFITDRGRPAHVLLTYGANIVDLLAMPEAGEIEFEPVRVGQVFRSADLS